MLCGEEFFLVTTAIPPSTTSNQSSEVIKFAIDGMTCAACAARATRVLRRVPGVLEVSVNFALERGQARVAKDEVSSNQLSDVIHKAGFEFSLIPESTSKWAEERRVVAEIELRRDRFKLRLAICLTAPLILQHIAFLAFGPDAHVMPFLEVALATPVQFILGARFYRAAISALRSRSANMDVLVVLGTTSAYGYSWYLMATLGDSAAGQLYFEASAVIITLVMMGKYLEEKAKRGTTEAVLKLMDLRPEQACVSKEGTEEWVTVDKVRKDDLVIVRPGERIPIDGDIAEGDSDVDESLLTGESMPIPKYEGERVIGGSINGSGLLKIRATAVGEDTTLAKIVHLVENAQSGNAPVQRLVDQVTQVFVPIVISIAIATIVLWLSLAGEFGAGLIAAVSVLVIACPCALGLATPTAIVTGTGAAARAGILIKDVATLGQTYKLDTVVFDKTGTLTQGKPLVVSLESIQGDTNSLLEFGAAVQQGSEHPIGRAFLEAAEAQCINLPGVKDFKSITGFGAEGWVSGKQVLVGSRSWLRQRGISTKPGEVTADLWESNGRTVVWVVVSNSLQGIVGIEDQLREPSIAAVAQLKALNIQTILYSGDSTAVAQRVGRLVNIDEVRAGMRPEDKVQGIESLRSKGHLVGMVGDGVNDAPALAAADVGIAIGSGTDVAMETAGIILIRPDPQLVADAISISRSTWRKVYQNLFWAFAYNVVGIPLAAMGYLSPILAGAAMAMSSVSVVSNSLLLKRWRPRAISGMETE